MGTISVSDKLGLMAVVLLYLILLSPLFVEFNEQQKREAAQRASVAAEAGGGYEVDYSRIDENIITITVSREHDFSAFTKAVAEVNKGGYALISLDGIRLAKLPDGSEVVTLLVVKK